MPTAWLKSLGSAAQPLTADWTISRPDVLVNIGYPQRPSIGLGDLLAAYAASHRVLPGLLIVTGNPYLARAGEAYFDRDYPWRTYVRALRIVPDLAEAPPLEALIVSRDLNLSVRQQSHIRLTEEEVDRLSGLFGPLVVRTALAANVPVAAPLGVPIRASR